MSRNRGYGGGREEPAEKPYGLVSLPEGIRRKPPQGHDRFRERLLTGKLRGKIIALSPVHISSGGLELGERIPLPPTGGRNPELVRPMVRSKGVPIIPGSSLKGVIRSVVEAVSPSCLCKTRARREEIPQGLGECRRKDSLCVACRLFGSMGFQGNVRIDDAALIPVQGKYATRIEMSPQLYAPTPRRRGYYRRGQVAGRKFYMHGRQARGNTPIETCPVNSQFDFTVRFENLARGELGLLLLATGMSESHSFRLKIGGSKPSCYGAVEVRLEEVIVENSVAASYLDFDAAERNSHTGEAMAQLTSDLIREATQDRDLVSQQQLTRLRELLRYPNDRESPSGFY